MRDLELLTSKQIELEDIYGVIDKNFKIKGSSNEGIFFGKYPNSVDITFKKSRMFSDCEFESDLFEEEYKGKIPIENAFRTSVRYHVTSITKKLVTSLLPLFPELCIYDNDEDWLGTAKEYLDKE